MILQGDPSLLPQGNPFKCNEEVLYLQPMIPPKRFDIFSLIRAVLMGTKSCTKILNFSTRFSCENLAVEDFVTLLYGEKILLMGKSYVWA